MSRPTIAPVVRDNTKRPLWSVMIPIYLPNPDWLREAIEGALGAGLAPEDLQLAIVDDGNGEICEGDADSFWRECEELDIEVHRFADKAGLPGNWNRCIELSRGQIIHILHQDDRVRPEFYSTMARAFEANPRTGAGFSQHAFISKDGTVLWTGHLHRSAAGLLDEWPEYVTANLAIQCPAIAVRRAVYEKLGGFDTSYGYCPDYDMWQRIAAEYPLWYDPTPLADFRIHDRSASSSLLRGVKPWLEVRRCREQAITKISPPARELVGISARRHTVRLAMRDTQAAVKAREWRRSIAAFAGAVVNGSFGDFVAVARGQYDFAPASRPPPRPETIAADRLPRILLLTEFYPANPATCVFGAFQRLRRHIETLSDMGPVDVVFFWPGYKVSPKELLGRAEVIKEIWPVAGNVRFIDVSPKPRSLLQWMSDGLWALRGAVGFFHTAATMRTSGHNQATELRRQLQELQPDFIFAHRLGAAAPLIRTRVSLPPVIVDIDDLEHIKLGRLAASMPRSWRRSATIAQSWLALHALRRMSKWANCLLVASELDQSKLLKSCPGARVAVIPNTATTFDALPGPEGPIALFVGTAAYAPNREAIVWLMTEIWPLVRKEIPTARLLLAGDGTGEVAKEYSTEGIEGLGFVADLASVYQRASMAVCPIRRGSGTRIKIIEAAMNGRPVVSTFIGAEGLAFEPGKEIILEDTSSGFASACVALMRNPDLASTVASAAMKRANTIYRSSRVSDMLSALCRGLTSDFSLTATAVEDKTIPI